MCWRISLRYHSGNCLLASCTGWHYSPRITRGNYHYQISPNLVWQQNRSLRTSHLYTGIITSPAVDSHIHRDGERFKLLDVQTTVESFQLNFLSRLCSSVPLQTIFGVSRKLAVDDGDEAKPQQKMHNLLHLLKSYLFKRLIKFTKEWRNFYKTNLKSYYFKAFLYSLILDICLLRRNAETRL